MRHAPPNPASPEAGLAQRLQQLEVRMAQQENSINAGYPWVAMTFGGSWKNYDATVFSAGATSKDRTGWVRLKGLVEPTIKTVPGVENNVIAQMPADCLPGRQMVFTCWFSGITVRIDVATSGQVLYVQGPETKLKDYLALNQIAFQANAI